MAARKPLPTTPKTPRAQSAEEARGSAFVPTDGAAARGFTPTKAEAGGVAPFLLVHDPERWTVMGGQVIPQFCRMPLIGGVNGCDLVKRADGTSRVISGPAKQAAEERGRIVIPVNAIPDHHQRGDVKSYLWQPQGRPDLTLLIYTRVFPGSDVMDVDVPAYLEFCQHLIDIKLIEPAPTFVLRRMADKQQDRVDKLGDKVAAAPSLKPQLVAAVKELEAIRAALTTRDAEVAEQRPSGGMAVEAE
jgi:hypothetical protein